MTKPTSIKITPELVEAAREYWLAAWEAGKLVTEKLEKEESEVVPQGAQLLAFASLFQATANALDAPLEYALAAAANLLGTDIGAGGATIH